MTGDNPEAIPETHRRRGLQTIVTPYLDVSKLGLTRFLGANGLDVPRLDSMMFTTPGLTTP